MVCLNEKPERYTIFWSENIMIDYQSQIYVNSTNVALTTNTSASVRCPIIELIYPELKLFVIFIINGYSVEMHILILL